MGLCPFQQAPTTVSGQAEEDPRKNRTQQGEADQRDHQRDCRSFNHGFAAVRHDLPAGNQGHSDRRRERRFRGRGQRTRWEISTRIRALTSAVASQRQLPSSAIRRRPNRCKWMRLKSFFLDEERQSVAPEARMTIWPRKEPCP